MRHSLQLAKPKMIIVAEFLIDTIDSVGIYSFVYYMCRYVDMYTVYV